jgi:hypothetical protein
VGLVAVDRDLQFLRRDREWVSELHDEYAEPTVASVFAAFSTVLTGAVRARLIPANPCYGVKVTTGDYGPSAWWPHRCRRCGRR